MRESSRFSERMLGVVVGAIGTASDRYAEGPETFDCSSVLHFSIYTFDCSFCSSFLNIIGILFTQSKLHCCQTTNVTKVCGHCWEPPIRSVVSLLDPIVLFVGRGVTTHSHITGLKRPTVTFAARKTSELMDALFEQPREFVSKSITQTGTNKHVCFLVDSYQQYDS